MNPPGSSSISSKTFPTARSLPSIVTVILPISVPVRMSRTPAELARSNLPTSPAHITRATSAILSSSASMGRLSKTRPRWTPTSRCSRRRKSATIASSDVRWSSFASMTTSGRVCPSGFRKGAVLIEELEKLAKETEFAAGYQRVRTPHIATREHVCVQRAPSLLRRFDVSSDGTSRRRGKETEGQAKCRAGDR